MTAILDRETSLSIFERMLTMRHFEEAIILLYNEGRFASHYHIYIGQEATGAGVLRLATRISSARRIEITATSLGEAATRDAQWRKF